MKNIKIKELINLWYFVKVYYVLSLDDDRFMYEVEKLIHRFKDDTVKRDIVS